MLEQPISRYPIPVLADLPADIQAQIREVEESTGFIPNVFLFMARRPAEFRAFFAYYDALMQRESSLSKADKELIIVATSAHNHCQYCVIVHGALLRIFARDPLLADQVTVNYQRANITPRQAAMLDFALKVAGESHMITEADFDSLKEHGFDEEDIWDIGAITGLFALSNRMANMGLLRPNEEFFLMGRERRKKK